MFNTKLPSFRGDYNVGYVDIETHPKAEAKKDTETSILYRMYYPTEELQGTRTAWLTDCWFYAKGYGSFLKIPVFLIALIIYPALSFAKLASFHRPKLAKGQLPEKLPIAVFSHGLAGMRTTYSTLCGNLASRGFIVIALEHGDGSGCATSRDGKSTIIPYQHFIPSPDVMMPGETEREYGLRFRGSQLRTRANAVFEALDTLQHLNAGNLDFILPHDNETRLADYKNLLLSFKSRLDFENKLMIGHSFGGATSVTVLDESVNKKAPHTFKCAVVMDPWMHAVPHTATRFNWRENIEHQKRLMGMPGTHKDSRFGYITDTKHNDVSDFSLLYPKVMLLAKQSGPAHPLETHLVLEEVLFDFIQNYIPLPVAFSRSPHVDVDGRTVFGQQAYIDILATEIVR
ncbi:Platelet-activating factor acetylhydrolase [Globomyces sp. JEL0801]|nr:Platelet-activating factor acetylhydrolase [Globomyces sp. JEL0801]